MSGSPMFFFLTVGLQLEQDSNEPTPRFQHAQLESDRKRAAFEISVLVCER